MQGLRVNVLLLLLLLILLLVDFVFKTRHTISSKGEGAS